MADTNLTPELMAKAKGCKTTNELADVAREAGVELTIEQLDAISGGRIPTDWSSGCSQEDFNDPCSVYVCARVYCDAYECNDYKVIGTDSECSAVDYR